MTCVSKPFKTGSLAHYHVKFLAVSELSLGTRSKAAPEKNAKEAIGLLSPSRVVGPPFHGLV